MSHYFLQGYVLKFFRNDFSKFYSILQGKPVSSRLDTILKTVRGKIISEYYKRNGVLDNRSRNSLTTLLIENEYTNMMNKNVPFKLTRYTMEEITSEIRSHFPTESNDVYFIPSSSKRQMAGKLWKSFNNFKSKMKLIAQRADKATKLK